MGPSAHCVGTSPSRGHSSPPDGEERLSSGPLDTCADWSPLKLEVT